MNSRIWTAHRAAGHISSPRRICGLGLILGWILLVVLPAYAGFLDLGWDAPITNDDPAGSPLTDLGLYRIYFGTGTAPCPGPSFQEMPSPTTTPNSGDTLALRLGGLTPGTTYFVQVTAVDIHEIESACSNKVGGVAMAGPGDPSLPTVSISVPTSRATYSTSNHIPTLGGSVTGDVAVTQVTWVNDRGGSGVATGTTNWTVSGIGLEPGTNVLTVMAWDATGIAGSAVLIVNHTPPPLSQGLVAAYAFEEGSGPTATDASGNGHAGAVNGGVARTTSGQYGNSLSFDGTTGYVSVASPNLPTGDYTWEAWVNPNQTTNSQALLGSRGLEDSPGGLELDLDTGGKIIIWSNGALRLTSAITILSGAWSHVALTRAGDTLRLYLNGTLDPNTGTDAVAHDFSSAGAECPLLIGVDDDSSCTDTLNSFFSGRIDEVRIYNRALSATEIQVAMNTPISTTPSNSPDPSSPSIPIATGGGATGGGGGCFIATAAYGSPLAPQVQLLRDFRNRHLLPYPIGRTFVRMYYRLSPPLADFIATSQSLRAIVRVGLLPIIAWITLVLWSPLLGLATLLLTVGLLLWPILRLLRILRANKLTYKPISIIERATPNVEVVYRSPDL